MSEKKRATPREHGQLPPKSYPGEWGLIKVRFDGSPYETYTYWAPASGTLLNPGDKVQVWVSEGRAPTVTVVHGTGPVITETALAHKAIMRVVSRAKPKQPPIAAASRATPGKSPDAVTTDGKAIDFKTLPLEAMEFRINAAMENQQSWHDDIVDAQFDVSKDIYRQITDRYFKDAHEAAVPRFLGMPPSLGMGYGLSYYEQLVERRKRFDRMLQDSLIAQMQKQHTTLVMPAGQGKSSFAETARAAGIKVHEVAEGLLGKKTDFYIIDEPATMDFETYKSLDLRQKWDAITGRTNQPFKHNRIKPKENTVELKIKTVTYVNEQDVSRLTADQLFSYINAAENEIRALSSLINQPKAVAKRIAELEAGIAALLVAADGEDAAPYKPVIEPTFRERLAETLPKTE